VLFFTRFFCFTMPQYISKRYKFLDISTVQIWMKGTNYETLPYVVSFVSL
jgi:hypothetical protein